MAAVARRSTTTQTAMPPVATVARSAEGALRHAHCGRTLEFLGGRAGLELDFYCFGCCEHVTLTPYALARVPLAAAVSAR